MMQHLKPIKEMNQHVCTFALYSHDMPRQSKLTTSLPDSTRTSFSAQFTTLTNSNGRLIGVEYIISHKIFEALPLEEQKLWHSHAYEIKSRPWMNPRVPELRGRPELENLAKTYGKFWCTWQVDRGDRLQLGALALMMSPQSVNLGLVHPVLVQKRDDKYNISTDALRQARVEIDEPEWISPQADTTGSGTAVVLPSILSRLK